MKYMDHHRHNSSRIWPHPPGRFRLDIGLGIPHRIHRIRGPLRVLLLRRGSRMPGQGRAGNPSLRNTQRAYICCLRRRIYALRRRRHRGNSQLLCRECLGYSRLQSYRIPLLLMARMRRVSERYIVRPSNPWFPHR